MRKLAAGAIAALAVVLAACTSTATPTTSTTRPTVHHSLVAPQYQRLMDVTHNSIGVPAVIPAGGVAVFGTRSNGVNPILIYVRQAKPVPGMISASKAAADARYFGGGAGQKVTKVVFGAVTDPGSIPAAPTLPPKSALINRPAWIVMLSYPRPITMLGGCLGGLNDRPAVCHHFRTSGNLVILSPTGGFLEGFEA